MPDNETLERAREDAREGKAPSTQAGEFVREEIHHIREGKHGAQSTKQAVAIGLSKARRAGVKLAQPRNGTVSEKTAEQASRDSREGQSHSQKRPSARRSRAATTALRREGSTAASTRSLSKQARKSARKRGSSARRTAAMKAVRTNGKKGRNPAARKTARTRAAA